MLWIIECLNASNGEEHYLLSGLPDSWYILTINIIYNVSTVYKIKTNGWKEVSCLINV